MIIILGACHILGQRAAVAMAERGTRVVAIDNDAAALEGVRAQNPDWIEVLCIDNIETRIAPLLKDAWATQRIDMVVNLLPLAHPADISAQMRTLTAILHTTLRGLVAGRGSLVNVVGQPADPLAFVAHGMGAAVRGASTALGAELGPKGVAVHCLGLPPKSSAHALETLMYLASPAGRALRNTALDLGNRAP